MPTPEDWPTQAEADAFYGNPRGKDGNFSAWWYNQNLTKIIPPYKVMFGHIPITRIIIHRRCASSALRILNSVWEKIGRDQAKADELGISKFSGSFNYRVIRGGNRLSMHAYGCAWDWDAPNNWLGDRTPTFEEPKGDPLVVGTDHPFVQAHLEEGWTWGFDWNRDKIENERRPDAMHFQAARVS